MMKLPVRRRDSRRVEPSVAGVTLCIRNCVTVIGRQESMNDEHNTKRCGLMRIFRKRRSAIRGDTERILVAKVSRHPADGITRDEFEMLYA